MSDAPNTLQMTQTSPTITYKDVGEQDWHESSGRIVEATRVLQCAWSDRWQLAQQLRGHVATRLRVDVAGTTTVDFVDTMFTVPQLHPASLSSYMQQAYLYCDRIDAITPYGKHLQTADDSSADQYTLAWEYAHLRVHYTAVNWPGTGPDTARGVLWQETKVPSSEFVTVPRDGFYWDPNTGSLADRHPIGYESAPGFQLRYHEWQVTRRMAPLIYPRQCEAFFNCVNLEPVASPIYGTTYAPGMLLYEQMTIDEDRMPDGSPACALTLHFKSRNQPWNWFPNATAVDSNGNVKYQPIYLASGTTSGGSPDPAKPGGDEFVPYKLVDLRYLLGW